MRHDTGQTKFMRANVEASGISKLPSTKRSMTTRLLHMLILVCVLHQLIGSNLLSRPLPGEPPEFSLLLHEYIGMGSMAVVVIFWIWTLVRTNETSISRLLPWLSKSGVKSVLNDTGAQLGRLIHGKAPDNTDGALASAVHGLGLLTLTAMAFTGTVYFFTTGTPSGKLVLSVHKLIANLMWGYLIAHAGLAVLHQLLGSDMVSRMFWRRASPSKT